MSQSRPNIVFIMSDDHAAHAIGAYGSRINETPNIDRIAEAGVRLNNCFCTNSICAPSRASILTGLYSHKNGVKTLREGLDGRLPNVAKSLQASGYQTAIVGKWHLGHGGVHDPTGFDYWNVLPGQGDYVDPEFIDMGVRRRYEGYVTNIITDLALDWLKARDKGRPFFLMLHHKAPHRPWIPDEKYADLYADVEIPEPPTFYDDYSNRAEAARVAKMRIESDLKPQDLKEEPPGGLTPLERKRWNYQRYIKDYLRCVASIDDSVGRVLDYLQSENIFEDTIVVYTSDQGFFLGDHGWYDKRFIYEESIRMPMLISYPREIPAGSVVNDIVLNVDFAPTFLDYAGVEPDWETDGVSARAVWRGEAPATWRQSMYYHYFTNRSPHNVYAHYGVRTHRYKLVTYYKEDDPGYREWELFDLEKDPHELKSVYDDPAYAPVVAELKEKLQRLRDELGDTTG